MNEDLQAVQDAAAAAGSDATTAVKLVPAAPAIAGRTVTLTWTPADVDGVETRWGDGTDVEYLTGGGAHTYAAAGTYTITLDPYGVTRGVTFPVTVA